MSNENKIPCIMTLDVFVPAKYKTEVDLEPIIENFLPASRVDKLVDELKSKNIPIIIKVSNDTPISDLDAIHRRYSSLYGYDCAVYPEDELNKIYQPALVDILVITDTTILRCYSEEDFYRSNFGDDTGARTISQYYDELEVIPGSDKIDTDAIQVFIDDFRR